MIFVFLLYLLFAVSMLAGWVNNIIWLFQQSEIINVILGVVGIFAAPIGAIHGLYLFFV